MRILQPAEWQKPRGFSHGVAFEGPGRWIVLAGQTGGDEKGDYAPDMAAQVATALKRIIKLLAEAGGRPEHIVRLTWYLTSRFLPVVNVNYIARTISYWSFSLLKTVENRSMATLMATPCKFRQVSTGSAFLPSRSAPACTAY